MNNSSYNTITPIDNKTQTIDDKQLNNLPYNKIEMIDDKQLNNTILEIDDKELNNTSQTIDDDEQSDDSPYNTIIAIDDERLNDPVFYKNYLEYWDNYEKNKIIPPPISSEAWSELTEKIKKYGTRNSLYSCDVGKTNFIYLKESPLW